MAETRGVWGIDIGEAGLKAIRLRLDEATGQVVADAFDYVAHPKILSQPDAIPEELIPQALSKFLERNDVKDDKIAISVPGQSALARFIQLPPVESSKIAEIVKYEARQQIPFALDEVIWDWQTLGGGVEESGFMLEAEVGLFAMKRDQVMQRLRPFTNAGLEIELIQIASLALYSYLSYDVLGIRPEDETIAMDAYTIALDMGSDTTTLVVTNGQKIWIRNINIGGNHFTRALTKEMKLTFAKAEHLKCNATKSPDPRSVFQALRPVFNDYVSEIQRSIGYFSSVNRDAKIARVIGLGNGFKLAGLQKFLQQNLQYEVDRIDGFQALTGDSVLGAQLFEQNVLSFAVAYGVALQGLGMTRMHTSLLPPEIATARIIRKKKPIAVATAAGLLALLSLSMLGYARDYGAVSPTRWDVPIKAVDSLQKDIGDQSGLFGKLKGDNTKFRTEAERLTRVLDNRELWMELLKAINECLPRDTGQAREETDPAKKNQIILKTISAQRYDDLDTEWFAHIASDTNRRGAMAPMEKSPPTSMDPKAPSSGKKSGYVITLEGVHYYKGDMKTSMGLPAHGVVYLEETLLKNLRKWTIANTGGAPFPVGKLGISHAYIASQMTESSKLFSEKDDVRTISGNPNESRERRGGRHDRADDAPGRTTSAPGLPEQVPSRQSTDKGEKTALLDETVFSIQFAWIPTVPAARPDKPPDAKKAPAAKAAGEKTKGAAN